MSSPSAKRALIYVRLSSYKGETDTTTSPERQEEACRAYAFAQGWNVIDVVYDLDVSGSDKGLRLDRPGLLKVRAAWASADVLLFAKIDRLARNVLDWSRIREEADSNGVALVSVADSLDLTTPGGRFVATILQAFAEMEAAMISTRTREAVAYLAREGRHRGGSVPFGWTSAPRADGPGFRLVLDPIQAPVVREAVDRVIAGESAASVADDFNARQVLSTNEAWIAKSLRALLVRPILRGMLVHHGDLVRDSTGLPIRPHEPLLTDAEWTRLQTALAWSSPRPSSPDEGLQEFSLLRGLVTCSLCRKRLHSGLTKGKYPQWRCSRSTVIPGTTAKCSGTAIARGPLEDHVISEVLRVVGDTPGVEVVMEERADEEIAEVEEALDAVTAAIRDVDDEAEEATLLVQRRALRARLKTLLAAPVLREASERPTGRTFRDDWATADDAGRTALLASVLAVVSVHRGRRGARGLDTSRVTLVFSANPTAAHGSITPGVVYRDAPFEEPDEAEAVPF
jgi:site-specific DNA recombinase